MASTINASNSGFGGIIQTGDSTGQLQLQTAGTTALTIDTSQNATFAGTLAATGKLTKASLPTGTILQVVSTNKTDTFTSAANATWTDITGMSVSITPTSATSKVMIVVSMFGVFWQQGFNGMILSLLRGSTFIGGGDAAGSRSQVIGTINSVGNSTSQIDVGMQYHLTYIDSPATTSATTYKLQFYQDAPANPIYVNRGRADTNSATYPRTSSSIIAIEVAA
jgi:hypothetical protein